MRLFRAREKTGEDWLRLFRTEFSLANSRAGELVIDGESFPQAFSDAASAADRAMPELQGSTQRTVGYLRALQWLTFTGDDEGQLFARIWTGGAEYGYGSSQRLVNGKVADGSLRLADGDLPLLAAVYACNWGDLYVGGCLGFGEMVAMRDSLLVPEFYGKVEGWFHLPTGSVQSFADRHELGTPEAALAALGKTWKW